MGIIERFEEEFLDVSSSRATVRELFELLVGALVFVAVSSALASYLLGRQAAIWVAAITVLIFSVTIVSQAYWAVTGREDYEK